jgi:tRNA (guanine-N7-)-methyltransferase
MTTLHSRTIRSFVRRQGKKTPAQHLAFETLWPHYGLSVNNRLDFNAIFGRSAETVLEIGFGNGGSLATMAANAPEKNFIGIEVYENGIGRLLASLQKMNLSNVRIIDQDAVEVLTNYIPDGCLQTVQIFFADPWPKKRHHKRRLIQDPFVALVAKKLKNHGILHLATDWMDYAYQMMDVLSNSDCFQNMAGQGQFAPRPAFRPLTKYEQRGLRLGHQTWDLLFQRENKC